MTYALLRFKTPAGYRTIRIKKDERTPDTTLKTGYLGAPVAGALAIVARADGRPELKIPGLALAGTAEDDRVSVANGVALPVIPFAAPPAAEDAPDAMQRINITYPLIPRSPKQGEAVYAYARIFFSPKISEVVYMVVEPAISEGDTVVLANIKQYIQQKLNVNFFLLTQEEAIAHLMRMLDNAFDYFRVAQGVREAYRYYIRRDFIGLGTIEPLMQDPFIEDVSCDGVGIPLYVYHRNPKVGSVRTNLSFATRDELDSFTMKLSERCGKSISVARPLLDGSLPDGSRVQATLGSDIARRGSNFTIRMFTQRPLTPTDMLQLGTCDLTMMAYYWFLIEHGFSFLVSGGTASGKTSLLNVLSLFIKPQMKIVSIEDTAELKLPHSHWVPEIARTPIAEEGKVDMFELLRESLRQRPDYIIVGEVRGKEAYVLFQQMATGHPGLSTIHAENMPKLIDRLSSPPISLPPSLIQNLDVILFLKRIKKGRLYQRKVFSTVEVLGHDSAKNAPVVSNVFSWNAVRDTFVPDQRSGLLKKVATMAGLSDAEIQDEIRKRATVLQWMVDRNITDYRKVAAVINLFYLSPDFLMQRIEKSGAASAATV